MAKKAKKKPMHRGRKLRHAEIPEPMNQGPPVAREVTIDSVTRDLSLIKSTLSNLL